MAVLIEAISVVIRVDRLHSRYPGGWDAFRDDVPNKTLCSDSELARVGFMAPPDTMAYIAGLEEFGLHYVKDGAAQDLVVVDQRCGFCANCEWAEFGRVEWEGNPEQRVALCRLKGSSENRLFTPDGWTYSHSLTSQHNFVPNERLSEQLEFLRHENGLDVCRDLRSGKEVYIGRTSA